MTIFEIIIFGIKIAPSYYGLMYVIGFLAGFYIIKKRGKVIPISKSILYGEKKYNNLLDNLFLYIFLGVILGGRLGYVFFYNLSSYINSPINILKIWEGGMSFHGGVVGVIISMLLFSKFYKIKFLNLADQITLVLPIGLGLGRIGNYLNRELLGYSGYEGIFSVYKNGVGYFPSPLLEAVLEGVLLFGILNFYYYYKNKKGQIIDGQIAGLFLILYSAFRLIVEIFFRLPDSHIGYIMGFLTIGEILTIPMLIGGIYLYKKLNIIKYSEKIIVGNKDLLKGLRAEIDEIDNSLLKILKKTIDKGYNFSQEDLVKIVDEASKETISDLYDKKEPLYPIVVLLEMRFQKVIEVGRIKAINNIPILQQGRWDEVLEKIKVKSKHLSINEDLVLFFWNTIHKKALELEDISN